MDQMMRLLHYCGLPVEDVDLINSDGKTMNKLLLEVGLLCHFFIWSFFFIINAYRTISATLPCTIVFVFSSFSAFSLDLTFAFLSPFMLIFGFNFLVILNLFLWLLLLLSNSLSLNL